MLPEQPAAARDCALIANQAHHFPRRSGIAGHDRLAQLLLGGLDDVQRSEIRAADEDRLPIRAIDDRVLPELARRSKFPSS